MSKIKICGECGLEFKDTYTKCPYCKSEYLKLKSPNDLDSTSSNFSNEIIYGLFYLKEDNNLFSFSKTKFFSIIIFIYIIYAFSPSLVSVVFGLIISTIAFLLGRKIHFKGDPSSSRARSNNNLFKDIGHMLFFWEGETLGKFRISKTKCISIILFFCLAFNIPTMELSLAFILSLIITIPIFIIGLAIHDSVESKSDNSKKSINQVKPKIAPKKEEIKPKTKSNTMKNIQKPKKSVYNTYEIQTVKLKSEFDIKMENARKLIEKRFPSPQLTNDKYNSILDSCVKVFNQRLDIIKTIISSSTEYSSKVEEEIQSNIMVLKEINNKLDTLNDELLINISETKREDVKNLLDEIDQLTDCVKEYK